MRKSEFQQLRLPFPGESIPHDEVGKQIEYSNKLASHDSAFHGWYRFVLSFPPHLVRKYIKDFKLTKTHTVLDPFCGTGTTLVESKLHGILSVGIEANPFPYFATSVKTDWEITPGELLKNAKEIAESAREKLEKQGVEDDWACIKIPANLELKKLNPESEKLLLKDSISPIPLHKVLVLLECIKEKIDSRFYNHLLLALANVLIFNISNLKFGPEVGVGKKKLDVPVVRPFLNQVKTIADDIMTIPNGKYTETRVYLGDSRKIGSILKPNSIDAVITSPPYPNEKDYTRITRLESVLLGFINNKTALRNSKKNLIRSNTRGVYKEDDDCKWVERHEKILEISNEIEKRRIEMDKTSGFERLYSKVTKLYFGGMLRHLSELRSILKPGAKLAYVVGDQASYLRVLIKTGEFLAEISRSLGYEFIRSDLFRTRFSTATGNHIKEEVVVLQWPGCGGKKNEKKER
jgi:DNA modification methylase